MRTIKCACGKTLETAHPRKKFCSQQCKQVFHNAVFRKAHPEYYIGYGTKYRAKNPEKVREYERKKYYSVTKYSERYKAYHRNYRKQLYQKNTIKEAARNKLNYHVKTRRMTRQPCTVCGNEKVQAHHPDYNQPLNVIWLCRPHHDETHNRKKYVATS